MGTGDGSTQYLVERERGISALAMCKDVSRGQKHPLCGEWGQDISTKWNDVEREYQHSLCECMEAKDIATHKVGRCQ